MDCQPPPACDAWRPLSPWRRPAPSWGSHWKRTRTETAKGASAPSIPPAGRSPARAPPGKRAVEGEVDLGHTRGGCEAALVGSIVAAERANIIERPCFAAHHPIPGHEIGIGRILRLGLEHGLVETGRQCVDQVDVARELVMLFLCNAPRHKDAEMTYGLVNAVDDGLSVGADFIDVLIEIEDPAERLLRWRDIVAF